MKIGSLFSGYGGLDMAVESVFDASPAWFCEFEAAPSKVLAAHWPSVPNLGDITVVDWSQVEPVDVITGGSPCQDLSHAGRRAGMTDGTRSNLWVQMREAIAALRPSTVIWENVRGAYSADADSAVEPCPGCVGDEPAGNLRALGRVLGDLSDLGYDARWHGLRAADVGAPHGRFRVFVVAHARRGTVPVQSVAESRGGVASLTDIDHDTTTDTTGRRGQWWRDASGQPRRPSDLSAGCGTGATADAARDGRYEGWPEPAGLVGGPDAAERGMPTGETRRMMGYLEHECEAEGRSDQVLRDVRRPDVPQAVQWALGGPDSVPVAPELLAELREHEAGRNEVGESLASAEVPDGCMPGLWQPIQLAGASYRPGTEQQRSVKPYDAVPVLPHDAALAGGSTEAVGCCGQGAGYGCSAWGQYAPAIHRWEILLGRIAPSPTEPGPRGGRRLSARAVEFMMGLPDGWVTDVPGISRNDQLKMLGNGVVPQQAAAAIGSMHVRRAAA